MAPSKRIAVAGGTGGVGRHVVEGLLEVKNKYSLHIIILSRSSQPDFTFNGSSAPILGIDYTDPQSISTVLAQHQIDTIISTLTRPAGTDEESVLPQLNLLKAALTVPSFRRFAPSEFAPSSTRIKSVAGFRWKTPIVDALRHAVASSGGRVEYTLFVNGFFMNYLGFGNTKPGGLRAHGHLMQMPFLVDIGKGTADLPGGTETRIWYTRGEDVGRFVAAATQLDVWPEESSMAGDVLTLGQVVETAERITGRKFVVNTWKEEDILAKIDPAPPSVMNNFPMEVMLSYARGEQVQDAVLNDLTDVKATTVEEFIKEWWSL